MLVELLFGLDDPGIVRGAQPDSGVPMLSRLIDAASALRQEGQIGVGCPEVRLNGQRLLVGRLGTVQISQALHDDA